MVERAAVNRDVAGSSPASGANSAELNASPNGQDLLVPILLQIEGNMFVLMRCGGLFRLANQLRWLGRAEGHIEF